MRFSDYDVEIMYNNYYKWSKIAISDLEYGLAKCRMHIN